MALTWNNPRVALVFIAAIVALAAGWFVGQMDGPVAQRLPIFTCHETAFGAPEREIPVSLTDQFGPEDVVVKLSKLLCTPLTKPKARDPKKKVYPVEKGDHLVCYLTTRHNMGGNQALTDQFGTAPKVFVLDYALLCEPADKTEA